MKAIILAVLLAVLCGGVAHASALDRVYPFVGVTQRWELVPYGPDQSDVLLVGGVAVSLGAFALQGQWRVDPQEDSTWRNEIELGIRLNLRSIF